MPESGASDISVTCHQPVHELILQQYARTALIAYKAIPTDVQHEGWGHPSALNISPTGYLYLLTTDLDSKYPEVHYRRALLDSVRELGILIHSIQHFSL